MHIRQIVFAVVLLGALVRFEHAKAEDGFPAAEWEHVTPAELGWSETEFGPSAILFGSDSLKRGCDRSARQGGGRVGQYD
jgi:hypothetical protein